MTLPRPCLRHVATAAAVMFLVSPGRAGERFDAWQADRPYTLAAWATHDYGGGGKLDVDYFLASGLNTGMDGRCAYNANRAMADVGDVPILYTVYMNKVLDLDGFVADFEKAGKHYKHIAALMLGDEVRSSFGQDGLKHMRQIRDWVVNHPDPAVRGLLLITCTPAGNNMSTQKHIRDYMNDTVDKMRPDAVLTQMYCFSKGEVRPEYYSSLQWFADWCAERGTSTWTAKATPRRSTKRLRRSTARSLAWARPLPGSTRRECITWTAPTTATRPGRPSITGPTPTTICRRGCAAASCSPTLRAPATATACW